MAEKREYENDRNDRKFDGKKLLILGSNVGAEDIVRYARENGAYTIVTDYFSTEKSSAKRLADEELFISTADTEELEEIIKTRQINGVLAGISEFNLKQAAYLAERCGLPFYCTKEQWDSIESKEKFRALCIQYKVPCPQIYYSGREMPDEILSLVSYPVVLKPVDANASRGVHICKNTEEVRKNWNDAKNHSCTGTILLEEFVEGKEFTAHYTISNGKVSFSCIDNRYPVCVNKHGDAEVTTVPIARIYPSLFLEKYSEVVNPQMIQLCESLNMKDGILFIQGFYDQQSSRFSIFEAGLRCAGEAPYRFLERINGINCMNVLVDHALLGESSLNLSKDDPALKGKCCGVVSFVTKGGVVGKIIGLEEAVKATSSVIDYESRYPEGSTTPDGNTLRQLMIRFVMICENREQMARDIRYLNDHIQVLNDMGEDMVLRFQPEELFKV